MKQCLLYICTGLPQSEIEHIGKYQTNYSSNAFIPPSIFHKNIIAGLSTEYDEIDVISAARIKSCLFI